MERGCGEAQPQRIVGAERLGNFKCRILFDALRLVSATQPRSLTTTYNRTVGK